MHEGEWYWEKKCRRKKIAGVCDERESCVANTWFIRQTKEKSLIMLVDVKQIDFMLVGEKYRKYTRDVKVIPREIQHRLVAVDPDKKVLKKDCNKSTDHEKKDLEAK